MFWSLLRPLARLLYASTNLENLSVALIDRGWCSSQPKPISKYQLPWYLINERGIVSFIPTSFAEECQDALTLGTKFKSSQNCGKPVEIYRSCRRGQSYSKQANILSKAPRNSVQIKHPWASPNDFPNLKPKPSNLAQVKVLTPHVSNSGLGNIGAVTIGQSYVLNVQFPDSHLVLMASCSVQMCGNSSAQLCFALITGASIL